MTGDLTDRLARIADANGVPQEAVRAICRELAECLAEEAAVFSAQHGAPDGRLRQGDEAHHSVIIQMADHLSRIGDARFPS